MRSFLRFNRGILSMPWPWQLWVVVLAVANGIAPLLFLDRIEARVTLAVFFVGMALMTALTARFGFSRILGLGHIAWLPLLVFLSSCVAETSTADSFGLWLRAVILVDTISLVIDGIDVVRFARGDRAETVAGLDPPIAA